jgi:ectoine hydroxylase-related dioxygenase (phytanoyl-CoA dioxygenase family)
MNSSLTVAQTAIRDTVNSNGFTLVHECLLAQDLDALRQEFPADAESERNLFVRDSVRRMTASPSIRVLANAMLGPHSFAVRALFFNKTPESNWKVAWQQDLKIAVREKFDAPGFSSWSVKDGVTHVQPPDVILESMLAIRLHLDESGADNGPLRCVPGSHKSGRFANDDILQIDKSLVVTCLAPAGSALLMRPLVVHASSSGTGARPRRVIHLEFANTELPNGLQWYERV